MNILVEKMADRIINYNGDDWNMNINHFDWVPGVGLYGVFKAYKCTKNKKYLDFLIKWIDNHLNEAHDKKTVNSTAPLLTVLEVYTITKNENYLKVCLEIAENIINEAPITVNGGLEHTVTEEVEGFGEQIWADTLFMVCIFLAKLGSVIGEKKYIDFSVNQLIIHHECLMNKQVGLFYHGWNCKQKNHMSGIFWGRANAWIIYSTMQILNISGNFEGKENIERNVMLHAKALRKFQKEDGSICTIINDQTSYSELSATAGIAAGIKLAVDAGILDNEFTSVYKKAIVSLEKYVSEDGSLENVSTGTPIMSDAQAYKNIALAPTLYGQGLAIILLTV